MRYLKILFLVIILPLLLQSCFETYSIDASCGVGGSISPTGIQVVSKFASIEFAITPNNGYQVASVSVDDTDLGAIEYFKFQRVTNNHIIHAEFVVIEGESDIDITIE